MCVVHIESLPAVLPSIQLQETGNLMLGTHYKYRRGSSLEHQLILSCTSIGKSIFFMGLEDPW
jgi:hypothetical protein